MSDDLELVKRLRGRQWSDQDVKRAADEIERLTKEVERLRIYETAAYDVQPAGTFVAMQAEAARLREALSFYADAMNWMPTHFMRTGFDGTIVECKSHAPVWYDDGRKARAALRGEEG